MCENCYKEDRWPAIDNGKTRRAVALLDRVYADGLQNGPISVVVRDWNLRDYHLKLTRYRARRPSEHALIEALLDMTYAERSSALAQFEGLAHTARAPAPVKSKVASASNRNLQRHVARVLAAARNLDKVIEDARSAGFEISPTGEVSAPAAA